MIARLPLVAALAWLMWPFGAARLGDWHFAKRDGQSQLLNTRGQVASNTPFDHAASADGTAIFGAVDAAMPAGMHAQLAHLRLRSRGLFTAEPGAHIAVGVTGAWRKDNPATAQNDGLLSGRGVIVSDVGGARAGSKRVPVIEIGSVASANSCTDPHAATRCATARGTTSRCWPRATAGGFCTYSATPTRKPVGPSTPPTSSCNGCATSRPHSCKPQNRRSGPCPRRFLR